MPVGTDKQLVILQFLSLMPQASRKGSFAVGEAGAKLAVALESEAAFFNY